MTSSGAENENPAQRLLLRTEKEPEATPLAPAPGPPLPHDPGRALDTARTRDRLDWEERCTAVQGRINRAYTLELRGKQTREFAWLVMRWCSVVLLGSCVISWTGWVAWLLVCVAGPVLALGLLGAAAGGGVELLAQFRQCALIRRGEKDHLEVYDPSLRPPVKSS